MSSSETMKLYSIKDKLEGFTAPIPFINDKVAIRWFLTMCETNIDIKQNREHFSFWEMGTWNKNTGKLTSLKKELKV